MQYAPNQQEDNDSISVKELLLKIQKWFKYLVGKWVTILIFAVLGAALGVIASFINKKKYVAELTFILEENNTNALGAYMGLASQFGIDLGGTASSGIFTGENIIQFLKSRLIIEKTFLSPVTENGKTISLAERYIRFNNLREGWKEDATLRDIKFPLNLDRSHFSLKQDSILNEMYKDVIKSKLKVEKTDPKLSFISVKVSTIDELFSKVFSETLVNKAIDFYVDTKTKRAKESVNRLQGQADTLEDFLNRKTYSLAAKQDINLNPAKQMANVGTELALRDKMVFQTMYAEVMKNLEMSKMAMTQETPVIQIVDTPILPLKKEALGKVKGASIGGLLGGFLVTMFLFIKKLYKSIMEE